MSVRTVTQDNSFPHAWQVEILDKAPLIAPPRQYVYPRAVEEVERGALQILLREKTGAPAVLATFALGFADTALPHGIWSCPNPLELCAAAGGYVYLLQANDPGAWNQVPYRPVTSIHPAPEPNLLIFSSFHRLWALGREGCAWETAPLSWEGLRVTSIEGGELHGFGWDIQSDREVPFTVDLQTGKHRGGAGPSVSAE